MTTVDHQPFEIAARIAGLHDALKDGPAHLTELVGRLRAIGSDVTEVEVERELRSCPDVLETEDGWVSLVVGSEGVVLTHVLTSEELDLGVLAADGDLDLWAMLADEGLALASGGEVRTRWHLGRERLPGGCASGLRGPEGWLDAFAPGAMLALRMENSALVVESLQQVELDPDDERRVDLYAFCSRKAADGLSEHLADVDRQLVDASPWVPLDIAIAQLVVEEPNLLRAPLPPLGTLLAARDCSWRADTFL